MLERLTLRRIQRQHIDQRHVVAALGQGFQLRGGNGRIADKAYVLRESCSGQSCMVCRFRTHHRATNRYSTNASYSRKSGTIDVCAGLDQATALPGIDAGPVGLVGRHTDRDATDCFAVLDLDKAIAERHKLRPGKLILRDDALDQDLLGEVDVVVSRAVDAGEEGCRPGARPPRPARRARRCRRRDSSAPRGRPAPGASPGRRAPSTHQARACPALSSATRCWMRAHSRSR